MDSMTTMNEFDAKLEQFATSAAQDAAYADQMRLRITEGIFAVILPEFLSRVRNPQKDERPFDLFAAHNAGVEPTAYDEQTAAAVREHMDAINADYADAYATLMDVKKSWAKAVQEALRLSTSSKASADDLYVAQYEEKALHVVYRAALDRFQDARRAEEAFRHAPAAYEQQSLDTLFWLIRNILRTCQYTPGTDDLAERILNLFR